MIPFLNELLKKGIRKQSYDDLVDRLNYYYSTLFLLFLTVLVSAKEYVGSPISCWFPSEFKDNWIKYAESYCFVSNTYYAPFDQRIPYNRDVTKDRKIHYYQWIPIILAVQALMFYLPNLVWKMLCIQSGINVKAILKMAAEAECQEDHKRKGTLKTLARYIEDSLGLQSELGSVNEFRQCFCFRCVKRVNTYLTCLYMFTKLLYILNIVGQMVLLNTFFNTNYAVWGYKMFWDILSGKEWAESGHFPRVTMCDFTIRTLNENARYTAQCVLTINMFNEKIYLVLWIWLFFVGVCTVLNFVYWLFTMMPFYFRYRFVHKYLRVGAEMTNSPNDCSLTEKFVSKALRSDGVLLMRFISGHTGDMLVMELMFRLFQEFCKLLRVKQQSEKEKIPLHVFRNAAAADSCECSRNLDIPDEQNGMNESLYDIDKDKPIYTMLKENVRLKPSAPKIAVMVES